MDKEAMSTRWRLVLGEFANDQLPLEQNTYGEMDATLNFLYRNEYGDESGIRQDKSRGGRGYSVLTVPRWMHNVKKLFPKKTVEVMQKQALEKYNMTALLTDPAILKEMEPNLSLLKNLLSFRSMIPKNIKKLANDIIKKVVEDIEKKLESKVRKTFYGKKLPNSNTSYKIFRNFDIKRTIRKNLKNYNKEKKVMVAEKLYFNQNIKRSNPWDIIILVDESGSMMDSVIYTSVMAGIFSKLSFMSVKLVIFDTSVVDLSEHADEPVNILMKVQLGGGTDIHGAMEYSKKLIRNPNKTIVILVSDLYDGMDYRKMYRSGKDILEAGSRLLVLPALDYESTAVYDKTAAKYFAKLGADVAAITPEELAEWIGRIIL